jgi:hypothetical protein
MCYSSQKDFGWDTTKDAEGKPEARRESVPAQHPEPRTESEESRLWDFLARRREYQARKPMPDRIDEKV